jgi:hypothetical protein
MLTHAQEGIGCGYDKTGLMTDCPAFLHQRKIDDYSLINERAL